MLNFPDTRIRAEVLNRLSEKFPTINFAEEFYNLALSDIPTSGCEDMEKATTSSMDVKALKITIYSFEMGKLNEIASFSFLELENKNGIETNPVDFASLLFSSSSISKVFSLIFSK